MANVKITELTADTNPASTDVLPIVDVSANATKKVTIADLLENAGNGSEGAPAFSFDSDPDTGMLRSAANSLGFATGGTQRMRITSTGQMRLAGAGITFNGDTAAANELDDYEEGTFTPEYAGSTTAGTYTYSNRKGHYTKIGDMVNVTIKLANINTSTAGTGSINITGLPFASANNSSFACGSVVLDSFNVSESTCSLAVFNYPNTAILTIQETRDNTADSAISAGDKVNNFADIFCTITYRV